MNKIFEKQKRTGIFQFKAMRKWHDLTQKDIAIACGVTQPAVGKWDDNPGSIKVQHLRTIADLFETTVEEMLHGCT